MMIEGIERRIDSERFKVDELFDFEMLFSNPYMIVRVKALLQK